MRKTIVGLDAMRFVLAMYLMVFHTIHVYPQANDLPLIWLTDLGGLATSSFFIISGYILTHVYIDQTGALRGSTRAFFVKRFSEIYPIHFIGLFLFLLTVLMSTRSFDTFYLPSLGRGQQQIVQLSAVPAALNWLLNISMLRYGTLTTPRSTRLRGPWVACCFSISAFRYWPPGLHACVAKGLR